jgi:hypothetical protein
MQTQITIRLIILFSTTLAPQCISQKTSTVNPRLEAIFNLGEKNLFEKDLSDIKKIRDTDSYKVKVYSFLPKMIWSNKDDILLFDKVSGNLIAFNEKTQKTRNIFEISDDLKKKIKPLKYNIDLIDVNGELLQFYNEEDGNTMIYSLSKKTLLCSLSIPNSIGLKFDESTDSLYFLSYKFNYSTKDCIEHHRYKNKRVPINEGNSFIRHGDKLFYQTIGKGKLQNIDLVNYELSLNKINLANDFDVANFNLIHVNEKFYIVASNIDKGLGEFIFIDKESGAVNRNIKLNESIISNDLIDFYDVESDYPSPDVDDPNSYVRMTSIDDKYFIFFQSKGVLKLYSFFL